MVKGRTGCGLYTWLQSCFLSLGFNQIVLLLFQVFLFYYYMFVLSFLYIIVEKWRTTSKCELSGGGPPRHLNTFSNLFIVAVHFTHQYMLCMYCRCC